MADKNVTESRDVEDEGSGEGVQSKAVAERNKQREVSVEKQSREERERVEFEERERERVREEDELAEAYSSIPMSKTVAAHGKYLRKVKEYDESVMEVQEAEKWRYGSRTLAKYGRF